MVLEHFQARDVVDVVRRERPACALGTGGVRARDRERDDATAVDRSLACSVDDSHGSGHRRGRLHDLEQRGDRRLELLIPALVHEMILVHELDVRLSLRIL